MKNKKILVTGATGLLGSWLSESLVQNNCTVTGLALNTELDFLINSKKINKDIDLHYFDISNEEKLKTIFNQDYDLVFHLAAQTQVGDALVNPVNTFKSNIQGTWNILELCRLKGFPIVVASSDKAYGNSEILPYEESFPLNGVYPYEVSKSATDMLCKTYKNTYNLKVSTLRCGNIYGGGDLNWERLVPGVIKYLLNNETPILRSNGTYKRDWVYVEDVIHAYTGVGSALLDSGINVADSYNFSSTDYLSVIELYKKIVSKFSENYIEPIIQVSSEFEIKDQYLSSIKIEKELGISSNFDIDLGLENTINWYRKFVADI
jgi:CDP-glucose 4,6-dehydratase